MKSPLGLFAFWSYDRFPYVLGGPIEKMIEGGYIKATNYGSSCFNPIKILLESEGEELLLKLEELRVQHKKALDQVNDEYNIKLKELAPFVLK